MIDRENLCANGKVGYFTESGKSYVVRNPCQSQRVLGHILCDKCREEAGGLPKVKVQLPPRKAA